MGINGKNKGTGKDTKLLARSRRVLPNLEERIQKIIDAAFFWPVEAGEILMHFLIVNLNKLVLIRYVPYGRKLFFANFPGSLGSYRVGWNRLLLERMRVFASVCKPGEIIKTRAVGFAQTIRPQSVLHKT